jgi:nickel/cobalt transporter (NicO) family protein
MIRGLAVLGLGLMLAASAFAQEAPKKSPFGLAPPPASQSSSMTKASWAQQGWAWVESTQAQLNRDMAKAVRGLKSAEPVAAAITLSALSFAYGVLHAAGPGHGKAVISSYVLANRQTMRRGVLLSFMAAFFQACSALLLFAVLSLLFKSTNMEMKTAEITIERISWALIVAVGIWLLYRQIAPLITARASTPAAQGHSHGAAHAPTLHGAHAHAHAACTHDHHDHAHVHDANCGHSHMPEPAQLEGAWSWRKAIGLALTVGIRPCTGAILVLLFAAGQGLVWAGILATFVMSIGTALTVSVLAALAVGSRDLATRLAGGIDSQAAQRVSSAVGIAGALAVVVLGAIGFLTALKPPAPF